MPKERIYDSAGMYDIDVTWMGQQPDGYVQVGVSSHDGSPLSTLLNAVSDDEAATFTGLWGTLDRAGINRLIRTLRRARDYAYGADA